MNCRRIDCLRLIAVLLASAMTGGCAVHASVSAPVPIEPASVDVPPGHMPPPGACRIWYPDVPPGQQSPPGECYDLERRVPPGAVLVRN